MTVDYDDLLGFAVAQAEQAGDIIRYYFDRTDKDIELKADHTQVTAADLQINQQVIDAVKKAYPDHGVLAEEGSYEEHRTNLWVCDPIDGTDGFITGIPTAVFALAFVEDGVPKIAVIYDPFLRSVTTAIIGKGARCNGVVIRVSGHSIAMAKIMALTSYRAMLEAESFYRALMAKGAVVKLASGNMFKTALIARGNADAYIFPGSGAHDVAATKLIVEEAGGRVTDLYGNEQRYDQPIAGAIISNGHIHADLVQALTDFGPQNYLKPAAP